jgi:hypothetical protein
MTVIRIIKDWDYPDLLRQTPGNHGYWEDFQFTLHPVQECDYLIIINKIAYTENVSCPKNHIWSIIQEPPSGPYRKLHYGPVSASKVYTSEPRFIGNRYFHSHPALPWHINKNYSELKDTNIPEKLKDISWVTSSKTQLSGHQRRIFFLNAILPILPFDLFGYGFKPVRNKWEAISPYQYSIAVENYRNSYYWSEKISDCFLSFTMPIYYGCSKIYQYFPPEAMIIIDINDPKAAVDIIKTEIGRNKWKKNLDAIHYSRQMVLDHYQFFPFFVNEIKQHRCVNSSRCKASQNLLLKEDYQPIIRRMLSRARKILNL